MDRRRRLGGVLLMLAIIIISGLMVVLGLPNTALQLSFEHWVDFFPAWTHIMDPLVEKCQADLENYRANFRQHPRTGYRILNCVLNDFDEYRKAEMASATVVLGLAPALLQQLSPTYAETAVLATRRPVLALLATAGSPAVRLMETSNYADLLTKLKEEPAWKLPDYISTARSAIALSLVEYLLVAAAIANNAHLAYQLGVWTVCGFSPSQTTLVALWSVSAVIVHLIGWLILRLRFGFTAEDANGDATGDKETTWARTIGNLAFSEVTPLVWAPPVHLDKDTERPLFLVLASCLYIGCAMQALWGTIILSSLVFIGVQDATVVVIRYMASTLVCRLLTICELSGLRPVKYDRTDEAQ